MNTALPPLRALQAFEAFGRLGSVQGAARALGVTSGAVSQQLKLLEAHVGLPLFVKDGRRVILTPAAGAYHDLISQGFERLMLAQDYIANHRQNDELTVSGLPTLLQRWLNPLLPGFRAAAGDVPIRLVATHQESDPRTLEQSFRLTYGRAARGYAHSRVLFTDSCFPVCAPDFLARHPDARDPAVLALIHQAITACRAQGKYIGICGQGPSDHPDFAQWLANEGISSLSLNPDSVIATWQQLAG